MSRAREDDRFRHVTPESIVLPIPHSVMATSDVVEAEIWLDWGFVEFWKANYCEVHLMSCYLSDSGSRHRSTRVEC